MLITSCSNCVTRKLATLIRVHVVLSLPLFLTGVLTSCLAVRLLQGIPPVSIFTMAFGNLKTEQGVKALNDFLADRSYIEG